ERRSYCQSKVKPVFSTLITKVSVGMAKLLLLKRSSMIAFNCLGLLFVFTCSEVSILLSTVVNILLSQYIGTTANPALINNKATNPAISIEGRLIPACLRILILHSQYG